MAQKRGGAGGGGTGDRGAWWLRRPTAPDAPPPPAIRYYTADSTWYYGGGGPITYCARARLAMAKAAEEVGSDPGPGVEPGGALTCNQLPPHGRPGVLQCDAAAVAAFIEDMRGA